MRDLATRFLALTLILLCSATTAWAADPIGSYTIKGSNPGGGGTLAYRGTAEVKRTGNTFEVIWLVGNDRYVGTGVRDGDFFAVSYKLGNQSGLAIYRAEGDNWDGVWTYFGGKEVGWENWQRK